MARMVGWEGRRAGAMHIPVLSRPLPTWMGVPEMTTRSAQGRASSFWRSCMREFFSLWPSSGFEVW